MKKPHKNLRAWQLGMAIAADVYRLTEAFPREEKFGLSSQMRRCAVSIPSNIAEGAARHSKKEFVNFLYIASGSLSELDTQLELSNTLGFLDRPSWEQLDEKLLETDKVILGLIRRVRNEKSEE